MAEQYSAALGANVLTDITGGGASAGTYFLNICNRETSDRTIRVAITKGSAPTPAEYINYDKPIEGGGELSRWPVSLGAGWRVYVQASATGISAMLNGEQA